MADTTPDIILNLKTIREARGISGYELAKRIGCTPTTYYRYESGKRRIFLDQACALARYLVVSLNQLTGTEPFDPAEPVEWPAGHPNDAATRASLEEAGITDSSQPPAPATIDADDYEYLLEQGYTDDEITDGKPWRDGYSGGD
jgi:transcriptional regulator with XRE-family HTH domain